MSINECSFELFQSYIGNMRQYERVLEFYVCFPFIKSHLKPFKNSVWKFSSISQSKEGIFKDMPLILLCLIGSNYSQIEGIYTQYYNSEIYLNQREQQI